MVFLLQCPHLVSVRWFYLGLFHHTSSHDVQCLQRREVAPWPGALHPHPIVEKVAGERQVEVIVAESMVGQRLDG